MKELSIKEILDYCIVSGQSPLAQEGVIAYKELILSRIEEAEKKLKDMECCGNCERRRRVCLQKTRLDNSGVCDDYQPDNLTREERK